MTTRGWKVFCYAKESMLYPLKTERYPMACIKSIIFRYNMVNYNRQRIYTPMQSQVKKTSKEPLER